MPKVVSQKQLLANRRNAKKSTGPRTVSGKARSAINHTRHGLFARDLVLRTGPTVENPAEFEALRAAFRDGFKPGSDIERLYIDRLALCQWLIRRAHHLENSLLATDDFGGNLLNTLVRYEGRFQREFDRTMDRFAQNKKMALRTHLSATLYTRFPYLHLKPIHAEYLLQMDLDDNPPL